MVCCCAPTWAQVAPPAAPANAPIVPAEEPATVDGCQVIARIDGQVVLACELLWRVNLMLEENRERIPPGQYDEIRDQLMQRTLAGMVDQKLLYGEFRHNVPAENMPRIEQNLVGPFEEHEVPRLMKQLNVKSQRELAQELTRLGSSMEDAKRSFNEHVIASEWIRTKIKVSEEVGPEEMVEFYRDHRAEFEFPTQVRWEELTVHKGASPDDAKRAFTKLALMGNAVWPQMQANPAPDTPIFADVAKAQSEGFNAKDGGVHDWTTQGALKATAIDQALFSLPVGQMSPILDSGVAFHIIRVLERKEAGCRPFSEVQNDIRDKLKDERMAEAQRKYLTGLRKNAKIWTVYTGNVSVETLMGEPPSETRTR
jgi:PPIC-type PPIASE domain